MNTFVRWLERLARHAIVYPLLRLFLHNPAVGLPLNITSLHKILILRYDRIGDIVVTSPIFRLIKKANPQITLGVLASPSNAELLLHNPYVDRVHVLHSNWIALARQIVSAHEERYDLVLNFIFNRTTSGGLLANCIAPRGIKIGQGAEKYRFYFNVLLQLSRGSKHMAEVLGDILTAVFGIPVNKEDLSLEIPIDPEAETLVGEYLISRGLRSRLKKGKTLNEYVVFNLSATDAVRRISGEQAQFILSVLARELSCNTVVIASPSDEAWRTRVVKNAESRRCWSFPEAGHARLREIAALVRGARAVVTPDTAVVHLASAAKTPVLGLFTPLLAITEWMPFKVKHGIVLAEEGLPVSSIPTDRLRFELKKFLKKG